MPFDRLVPWVDARDTVVPTVPVLASFMVCFVLCFCLFFLFLGSTVTSLAFVFSPFQGTVVGTSLGYTIVLHFMHGALL